MNSINIHFGSSFYGSKTQVLFPVFGDVRTMIKKAGMPFYTHGCVTGGYGSFWFELSSPPLNKTEFIEVATLESAFSANDLFISRSVLWRILKAVLARPAKPVLKGFQVVHQLKLKLLLMNHLKILRIKVLDNLKRFFYVPTLIRKKHVINIQELLEETHSELCINRHYAKLLMGLFYL